MEVVTTTTTSNSNARRRSLSASNVQKDLLLAMKTKHERLKKKYGYLWKSLSCDPAVIQEYQSLLLLQTPAAATAAARLDHEETKTKNGSIVIPPHGLSNSSETRNNHEDDDDDDDDSDRIHNSSDDVSSDSDGAKENQEEKNAVTSSKQIEKTNAKIDFLAAVESRRPIQFQIGSCCDASNGCDGITCCTAPIVETETVEEEEEEVTTSSDVVRLLRRNNLSQVRDVHQEDDDTSTSVQSETESNGTLSFVERHETLQDGGKSVPLSQDDVDFDLSALHLHDDSVDEGEEADDERVTNTSGIVVGHDDDDGMSQEMDEEEIVNDCIGSSINIVHCDEKINSVHGEEMKATKNNYNDSDESVSRSAESSSSDDGTVTFTLNEASFMSAGIIAMDNDVGQEQQEFLSQGKEEEKMMKKTGETAEKNTRKESDSSVASSSDDAEWSENGSNKWVQVPEQTITSDKYSLETENKILIVEDSDDISYESSFSRNDEYSTTTTSESERSEKENRRFDFDSKDNSFSYIKKDEQASTGHAKISTSRSVPKDSSEPPKSQQQINRGQSSSNQRGKGNFKRNKEIITRQTFDEFDKLVFKNRLQDVQVQWSSRLIKTAGVTRLKKCRKGDSVSKTAMIELSTKLIDCEDRLRSTLCHEMCHAAQWLIDGVAKPPHGSCFKKWASLAMRKINGMLVTTTHDYVTNTFKFAWACSTQGCPVMIQRHSRSLDPNRHCCGKCKGRFIEIELPGRSHDISKNDYTPKKKRDASGFSLFVQNNSAQVRENLQTVNGGGKVSQKEVMKECAKLWRINTTTNDNAL